MSQIRARFTQGSILRHIVVMTLTSAIGMTFTFLIDFVTLFWIAQLNVPSMTAAVGIAGAVMFFTISLAIAFMIPAVALVSRSLGRGEIEKAREFATGSLLIIVGVLLSVAVLLMFFLEPLLALIGRGASAESLEYAKHFLLIVLPSIFFFGIGVTASAVLRAEGDAKRSMNVTLIGGFVAMIVDPIFIIMLNMGVTGAAIAFVLSRITMAGLGLYYIGIKYNFLIDPRQINFRAFAPPFFAIAIPALLTQTSTPIGNFILTRAIAPFGDEALAGFAVSFRVMLLGFGGVFALSGAIGGIIGQNYGAGHLDRVREAYVKAIGFGSIYSIITWGILLLLRPYLSAIFQLTPEASRVADHFVYVSFYFVFVSALFVSNAAFNNLGRPLWSTGMNWLRDLVIAVPALLFLVPMFGDVGVIYAQALSGAIAGTVAALIGWRYLEQISRGEVTVERVRA